MTDFDEIKERVRASLDLADFIRNDGIPLKGGPNEWKACCPFHAEKTPSFTVNSDKQIFHCFGCSANGDVFEYIMRKKGLDFPQALRLAANSVGIAVPERRVQRPREFMQERAERGAFDPEKFRALVPDGKVWNYLTKKRGLDGGLLVKYGVGETSDGEAYAFAYKWWPPGMVRKEGARPRFEFCKVVKVDRGEGGKKIEWREPKGGKNILFGMFAVPDDATELVIAEGEIDAITWAQYGFHAVSVPGGAGYLGWIDICYEWLERFRKIHISFDEDRAGRQKVVEVVQRLGMARTDIIRLPEKEAA